MRQFKEDFPLLRQSDLVYLDSAATAQRPDAVLAAEREFYEKYNANPLRGLYELGMEYQFSGIQLWTHPLEDWR